MAYSIILNNIIDRWVHLGEKRYPDGTRLVGHLERRGKGAYLHRVYGPLGGTTLLQSFHVPNVTIHESFYEFLSMHNGCNLFDGQLIVFGHRRSFDRSDVDAAACSPFDILTPAVTNLSKSPSKNGLMISRYYDRSVVFLEPSGMIFHIDSNLTIINYWTGLREWLESEAARLNPYFDMRGHAKVDLAELLPRPTPS